MSNMGQIERGQWEGWNDGIGEENSGYLGTEI